MASNDIDILQKVNIKLQKGNVDTTAINILENDILQRFAMLEGLEATAHPKINVAAEIGKVEGLKNVKKVAKELKSGIQELEKLNSKDVSVSLDRFINSGHFDNQTKEVQRSVRALQAAYQQLAEVQSRYKPSTDVAKQYERIAKGEESFHKISSNARKAELLELHDYRKQVTKLEQGIVGSFSNMGKKVIPSNLKEELNEITRKIAALISTKPEALVKPKREKVSPEAKAFYLNYARENIPKKIDPKTEKEVPVKQSEIRALAKGYAVAAQQKFDAEYERKLRESGRNDFEALTKQQKELQLQIKGYSGGFGSQISTKLASQVRQSSEITQNFAKATSQAVKKTEQTLDQLEAQVNAAVERAKKHSNKVASNVKDSEKVRAKKAEADELLPELGKLRSNKQLSEAQRERVEAAFSKVKNYREDAKSWLDRDATAKAEITKAERAAHNHQLSNDINSFVKERKTREARQKAEQVYSENLTAASEKIREYANTKASKAVLSGKVEDLRALTPADLKHARSLLEGNLSASDYARTAAGTHSTLGKSAVNEAFQLKEDAKEFLQILNSAVKAATKEVKAAEQRVHATLLAEGKQLAAEYARTGRPLIKADPAHTAGLHAYYSEELRRGTKEGAPSEELGKLKNNITHINQAMKDHAIDTSTPGLIERTTAGAKRMLGMFAQYGIAYSALYSVAAGVKDLAQATIDLEDNLKNIQAVTSATNTEMVTLSESIKNTASTTAFSINEISSAVMVVAQAGTQLKDIPKTVQAVADVATATGSNLAAVADIITTAQQVWDNVDVTTIGNRIAQASNVSKLAVEDLRTILSLEGSAANTANISLDQNLAMIATLRNAGVRPSTIATGSTQMMRELFSPDSKFAQFLVRQYEKIGEKVTEQQAMQTFSGFKTSENPLISAVNELKRLGVQSFSAMTELERTLDSRALNVFKPLLEASGDLQKLEAQIKTGMTAQESAGVASESLKKALGNLQDQVELTADALVEDMLPSIRHMVEFMTSGFKSWEEFTKSKKLEAERLGKSPTTAVVNEAGSLAIGAEAGAITSGAVGVVRGLVTGGLPGAVIQGTLGAVQGAMQGGTLGVAAGAVSKDIDILPSESGLFDKLLGRNESMHRPESAKKARPVDEPISSLLDIKGLSNKSVTRAIEGKVNEKVNEEDEFSKFQLYHKNGEVNQSSIAGVVNKAQSDLARSVDLFEKYTGGTVTDREKFVNIFKEKDANNPEIAYDKLREEFGGKTSLTEKQAGAVGTLAVGASENFDNVLKGALADYNRLSAIPEADRKANENKQLGVLQSLVETNKDFALAMRGKELPLERQAETAKAYLAPMQEIANGLRAQTKTTEEAGFSDFVRNLVGKPNDNEARTKVNAEIRSRITDYGPGYATTLEGLTTKAAGNSPVAKDVLSVIAAEKASAVKEMLDGLNKQVQAAFEKKELLLSTSDKSEATVNAIKDLETFIAKSDSVFQAAGIGKAQFSPNVGKDTGKYDDLIQRAVEKYPNVTFAQAKAIMLTENRGNPNPNAESPSGALGLMQVMPPSERSAAWLKEAYAKGRESFKSPENNVELGVRILSEAMKDQNGDFKKAAIQYNGGKGGVNAVLAADAQGVKLPSGRLSNGHYGWGQSQEYYPMALDWERKVRAGRVTSVDTSRLTEDPGKAIELLDEMRRDGFITTQKKFEAGDRLRVANAVATNAPQVRHNREIQEYYQSTEDRDAIAKAEKELEIAKQQDVKSVPAKLEKLKEVRTDEIKTHIAHLEAQPWSQEQIDKGENTRKVEELKLELGKLFETTEAEISKFTLDAKKLSAEWELTFAKDKQSKLKEDLALAVKAGKEAERAVVQEKLDSTNQLVNDLTIRVAKIKSRGAVDEEQQNQQVLRKVEEDIARNGLSSSESFLKTQENIAKDFDSRPMTGDSQSDYARRGELKALSQEESLKNQQQYALEKVKFRTGQISALLNQKQTTQDNFDAIANPDVKESVRADYAARLEDFDKAINAATESLSGLGVEVADLFPTLANQLNQISTDNIVSEINNLNGSLKNLDKNITQRVVQFADQASTDIADSAITAAKGLLGFNVATKEATDALLNLAEKEGNLALVQTNRVDLAQKVQSIRMNEADPVRQEELIKQAMDAQNRAEQLAQFQVNEAQKASDKVAYEQSLAGKMGNAATDMVGGMAKDVIKGEVLSLFTGAADGTEGNPLHVLVDNAGFGTPASSPTSTAGGLIGKAVSGISNWWNGTQDPAPVYNNPGQSTADFQAAVDSGSLAQGTGAVTDSVSTGAFEGVKTGISETWDKAGETFSGFTQDMGGKFDTFLAGFGALIGMQAAAKPKKDILDYVQMGLGLASTVMGIAGKFGAFSSGMGSNGIYSPTTGLGVAGPNYGLATGGYVTGPGTATSDSIPVMLSNGEYVIKADAVRHIGKDTLDKWNAMSQTPIKRATGGMVGTFSQAHKAATPAQQQTSVKAPDTNIRVVMVDDQRRVGDFINSSEGEKVMMEFVRKNSLSMKQYLR